MSVMDRKTLAGGIMRCKCEPPASSAQGGMVTIRGHNLFGERLCMHYISAILSDLCNLGMVQ